MIDTKIATNYKRQPREKKKETSLSLCILLAGRESNIAIFNDRHQDS